MHNMDSVTEWGTTRRSIGKQYLLSMQLFGMVNSR